MLQRIRTGKILPAWVLVLGLAGAGVACDGGQGGGDQDDVIIEDQQEGADLDPDIEDEPTE